MNTMNKECLIPWVNQESEILILGTMPGEESLQQQSYYVHPSNRFWRILHSIYDNCSSEDNKEFVLTNKIALWDCLSSCNRQGSADSTIKDEVPNNIEEFLDNNPNIRKIILNGTKALKAFKQCLSKQNIICPFVCCSSTSGANTRVTLKDQIVEWANALEVQCSMEDIPNNGVHSECINAGNKCSSPKREENIQCVTGTKENWLVIRNRIFAEYDNRLLKSRVRYNAIDKIGAFLKCKYLPIYEDMRILKQVDKRSIKDAYEREWKKSSINQAESSAFNEIYNQL